MVFFLVIVRQRGRERNQRDPKKAVGKSQKPKGSGDSQFQGDEEAVELVVNLVNSSPTIGKVKIDRRFFIYEGDGECSVFGFAIGIKRKQVLKMLSRRISADTNLIVL